MKNKLIKKIALAALSLSMAVTTVGGTASFYSNSFGTGQVVAATQKKYTYRGIDVSKWQGDINWEQVAADDNVDFVILRCGYGGNTASQDDASWEANVTACEKYGIPYGVYLYSMATTTEKLDSEVNHIKRLLKGHTPSLPVYLDMEEKTVIEACTPSQLSAFAKRYCTKIKKAGYRAGIYASTYYWYAYLDEFAKKDDNNHWLAQYNMDYCSYADEELVEQFNKSWAYFKDYHYYNVWQYASTGSVNGINGNVDMNYWYGSMDLITTTTAANTDSGVKLTWSSTPQASYYYIYRKETDADKYEEVDHVTPDKLKYVDTTAAAGTSYDYKIKLRTASGFTEAGPKAEILRLKTPMLTAVANYDKGMKVTWKKVAGADGYLVYRKTSADGKWESVDAIEGKTNVTYKDTDVKAGKKYYYTVRAYSDDGYTSAKDAEGDAYYRLATADLDEITNKSYGMYISWDEVSKASGYLIYRKSSESGAWEEIDKIEDGSTTEYKDKSVATKNGKNYYYTVRAYITKGGTDFKSAYDSEGLYYFKLQAPELKKAVKKSKYNKITWAENEKAGGYIIYRKTSKSGTWKKVATIEDEAKTAWKDTDVKKGKTYYYTVRAYKVKSGTKYTSVVDSTGLKIKR